MAEKKNIKETQTTNETDLIVKDLADLPMIMPPMDEKELFNTLQESRPIADLADQEFKITGLYPEWVELPKDQDNPDSELVERMRLLLLTDKGTFHSFSITLNKALCKAITIFKSTWMDQTFKFTVKMRGSGDGAKAAYQVKVL